MYALEDIGIDVSEILEPRGLSIEAVSNPDIFVHALIIYGLVEAAGDAAKIRGFCTAVGENLDLSTWFLGAHSICEAVTIGDLMTRFTRASTQETMATVHRLLFEGDWAHFSQHRAVKPPFAPAHTDAFMVGLWVPMLHSILGDEWIASQVVVTVCDPDALPKSFHGVKAIRGDRMGFSMAFPSSWLSTPIRRRSPVRSSGGPGTRPVPTERTTRERIEAGGVADRSKRALSF
jgi:hypothetical protein